MGKTYKLALGPKAAQSPHGWRDGLIVNTISGRSRSPVRDRGLWARKVLLPDWTDFESCAGRSVDDDFLGSERVEKWCAENRPGYCFARKAFLS